ncbi:type II toxin-antitoxin system ParD family antitoxin [Brevundimonas sp.]
MGTNVHLTPELETFARDRVAEGRYNNVSEVVRDGLRLLQDREDRRRAFDASLTAAVREADEIGWHSAEEVLAEMDAIIAAAEAKSKD